MIVGSIPILQVRGDSYVVYYEPIQGRRYCNKYASRYRMQAAQKQQYSGGMSGGARKRLTRAINLMSQAAKPRWIHNDITGQYQYHHLSFITLTVSSRRIISTREGYDQLLKPFLGWLRDTKGVTTYIWKLEFQERGQVHYHITLPDFIPYDEIKKTWNALQRKAGLLDEYAKQHGHFNPNSTDVHAVRQKKNIASYLVKELAKAVDAKRLKATSIVNSLIKAGEIPADDKKKFIDEYTGQELKADGKVWDCSNNLAGAVYFTLPMEQWHQEAFEQMRAAGELFEKVGDWWSIIYLRTNSPPPILKPSETTKLDQYLTTILN